VPVSTVRHVFLLASLLTFTVTAGRSLSIVTVCRAQCTALVINYNLLAGRRLSPVVTTVSPTGLQLFAVRASLWLPPVVLVDSVGSMLHWLDCSSLPLCVSSVWLFAVVIAMLTVFTQKQFSTEVPGSNELQRLTLQSSPSSVESSWHTGSVMPVYFIWSCPDLTSLSGCCHVASVSWIETVLPLGTATTRCWSLLTRSTCTVPAIL
jgi:hypothetical protein